MPLETKKDISDSPAANAVTSPHNRQELQADIDRKMRLYGVFKAFSEGKYPSNAQIEKTLDYGLNHSPIDESKLSEEGRELIDDFRSIIETASAIVKKKNADELFQNFLYSARKADSGKLNPQNVASVPVSGDEASQDGQQAAQHLKTLGKLLFTNSEVRKLLKDVGLLARDIGADAAVKVAEKARPGEDQLNQIDEPAPTGWVGPDGRTRGPNEPVPDTGLAEKREQAKQKKDELQTQYEQGKQEAQSHAQDAQNRTQGAYQSGGSGQQGFNQTGSSGQQGFGQSGVNDLGTAYSTQTYDNQAYGQTNQRPSGPADPVLPSIYGSTGAPTSSSTGGFSTSRSQEEQQRQGAAANEANQVASEKLDVANQKAQQLKDKIPQEHKDKAREVKGKTVDYLKEKVPEERRDKFIYRLKKVIVDNQKHDEYQEAIDFFLGTLENYKGAGKSVAGQTQEHADKSLTNDPHYTSAYRNLRTLLERFANNQSMQPIFDAVDQIYRDVQQDDELRAWFSKLDEYVRRVLQEPGFVMKDECDRQGRELRDNGKGFFNEQYRPHREAFTNSVQDFFKAYADDPLNVQFGQDWKRLIRDLTLDGDNNLTFKPHLWQDVRSVILPELLSAIGYVPIPRIEYTDKAIDLVIENLILDAPNLLPNAIEMEVKQYFKLSAFENIKNDNRRSVFVAFTQVQTDLKDVAFHFKRKQGFPKLSDSGLADVVISGKGISGKIHLETTDRSHDVFKVKSVVIKIDKMAFKIRNAKHSFLYAVVRPLAGNLIKNAVAKAMEVAIRNALDQLNQQLSDIKERLDDAKGRDDVTRTDVIKNVFAEKRSRAEEAKAKAEQTAEERNSQFKISATPGDQLVNWASDKSMIKKQGEREELIHSQEHKLGDGWKSPAFDWVSELQGKNTTRTV